MPTLNWIGKEAVVSHHLRVPFHPLKVVPDLSCGDPGSGNLLVQGDNLIAPKITSRDSSPVASIPFHTSHLPFFV